MSTAWTVSVDLQEGAREMLYVRAGCEGVSVRKYEGGRSCMISVGKMLRGDFLSSVCLAP